MDCERCKRAILRAGPVCEAFITEGGKDYHRCCWELVLLSRKLKETLAKIPDSHATHSSRFGDWLAKLFETREPTPEESVNGPADGWRKS